MQETKDKLEQEYIKVKEDIKVNLSSIKDYLSGIQSCKDQIDILGKRLVELQTEYQKIEEVK